MCSTGELRDNELDAHVLFIAAKETARSLGFLPRYLCVCLLCACLVMSCLLLLLCVLSACRQRLSSLCAWCATPHTHTHSASAVRERQPTADLRGVQQPELRVLAPDPRAGGARPGDLRHLLVPRDQQDRNLLPRSKRLCLVLRRRPGALGEGVIIFAEGYGGRHQGVVVVVVVEGGGRYIGRASAGDGGGKTLLPLVRWCLCAACIYIHSSAPSESRRTRAVSLSSCAPTDHLIIRLYIVVHNPTRTRMYVYVCTRVHFYKCLLWVLLFR